MITLQEERQPEEKVTSSSKQSQVKEYGIQDGPKHHHHHDMKGEGIVLQYHFSCPLMLRVNTPRCFNITCKWRQKLSS